jgi:hypothetical protein
VRRLLENRITVAAVLILFATAFAWNAAQGARTAIPWHFQAGFHPAAVANASAPLYDSQDQIAHGPGMPPDPWDQIAHGPGMPPDPWDQIRVTHGPGMPPDPWDQIAHGPGMPPDPWDQIRVTHGPGMPPDPWDQVRVG